MASIRRTQSPHHHDRAHLNGGLGCAAAPSPLSLSSSASSKSLSGAGAGGGTPTLLAALGRLLLGFFLPRPSRKTSAAAAGGGGGGGGWRPSLYRFFFCFLLGVLLGCAPFFGPSEIRTGAEFALDAGSSLSSSETSAAKSTTTTASLLPEFSLEERAAVSAELAEPAEVVRVELRSRADPGEGFVDRKLLIVVTPTYNRALQAFYLNRLGQTLRLVPPPLVWVVVESEAATAETAEVLRRSGVMYRHVVSDKNSTDVKDRGVHQRNTALELIELHKLDGIVYFADDDNVYSLELFDRLREIKRFGVWPVAMLAQGKAKAVLEGPVCNGTQVIGWHTNEKSKRLRRFHVDMSGFAFNSTILWDTKRWKRPTSAPIRQLDSVKEGFQETTFIEQLVEDENQMEGIPSGCSKIMNWHLHIESSGLVYPSGWLLEKNLNAVIPIKL